MNRIITALFLTLFLSATASAKDYSILTYTDFINAQAGLVDWYEVQITKEENTGAKTLAEAKEKFVRISFYRTEIDKVNSLHRDYRAKLYFDKEEADKKKDDLKKEKSNN